MKLHVAVPCYDRRVTCETARALLDESSVASAAGIDFRVNFAPGNSLITHARNQCVRDFLESDADRFLFVDSDVSWEPGALVALAAKPVDFCGGAYRYKADEEGYPVSWLDRDELWADPSTGMLEVAMLPGGFLSLSREVFKRLAEARPERLYTFSGQAFFAFFHCPPGDGEDGAFCRDWRDLGGSIWLEPRLTLTHVDGGGRKYTGCIGEWLKNR